jgi:pimeloyl-ACP methyl ester carboxylesterase
MPRARINGLTVHYQQTGSGPDLVLVHGLFCNLAFWYLSVVPALAERFRVTVYDLRGHGFSDGPEHGYRAVDLADDLAALMQHLDVESAHLVGHSFGGAVALACALRHSERIASLCLADAWIPSLQPSPLARSAEAQQDANERLRAAGIHVDENTPRVAHAFLEEFIDHGPSSTPGRAAAAQAFGLLTPGGNRNSLSLRRWRHLLQRTKAVQEMSDHEGLTAVEIRVMPKPVGLVFGARSRFLPSLHGLRRCLRHANVIVIPGAGHFFPIWSPQIFVSSVASLTGVEPEPVVASM